MKRIILSLVAVATVAGVIGFTTSASRSTADEISSIYVTEIPGPP